MGKIYDDIFRTLCEKNPKLLIPVINEVFGTHYSMTEKVRLLSGEHHILQDSETEESDGLEERITDSCICIENRLYHLECQSNPDGTMILRMVEYDFFIALEQAGKSEDGVYKMDFPASAVLYLRHNDSTPEYLKMIIRFPEGESVTYRIPVVKVKNYTEQDIVNKRLYFLIPYYIMRYENTPEKDIPSGLVSEYKELYNGMCEAYENGQINEYDMSNIIELTKKLAGYLFNDGDKAREGVDAVMGGQVLETYADKKMKQGIELGDRQGFGRGIELGDKQGFGRGIELMGKLSEKLAEDGRIKEISLAAKDENFFKELLLEYNIQGKA